MTKLTRLSRSILLASLIWSSPINQALSAQTTSETAASSNKFQTLYPGKWTERERPLVEKYLSDNAALEERGEIDVAALIAGALPASTPGIGPVIKVTDDWVRYNNSKYNPANPLYTDSAYARAAGFSDILAFPTFGAHDDTFMVPFPPKSRDTLLVSELNHSVTTYKPIHPGDTLYLVANSREMLDLTPQTGSIYRTIAINTKGSIYNQRGEKVNDVVFRVTESMKQYRDPKDVPVNPGFFDMWEAPDWTKRPAHFYTDADWTRIKSIWAAEKIRGATPLYWEDVKVGDRPAATLDGPIEASVSPIAPWGMGAGGSRSMQREIMNPKLAKTLLRGAKDGIYRLRDRASYVPATPKMDLPPGSPPVDGGISTTDIHKEGAKRSPLVNYMGRDIAIRHFTNWMGDKGQLRNISWSIMDPRGHADAGKRVIGNPRAPHWLDEVPSLKGRYVSTHGLTQDIALVQSEVVSKYLRNGQATVDLVWWIETIEGDIWEEGKVSIILPQKP